VRTLEYAAARVMLATLTWTPLPVAKAFAWFYAHLLDIVMPRLRRIAGQNLEMAGFEDRQRIVDGVFDSIGRLMVGFARLPRITRENVSSWIRYEGLENFTVAHSRGKGVLVATAHLGNWELSAYAHALLTAPMHIVVRSLDNNRIDRIVERYRAFSGNHIIEKWEAARGILRALKAGDAVGILIDQNTAADEGVFIDFFGVKACAGVAFARMAHHSGAAVVPGYAVWSQKERRYILYFEPEIEMTDDAAQDTQTIHSRLEAAIRRFPDQWLWIHRRWKTRPPGERPLY